MVRLSENPEYPETTVSIKSTILAASDSRVPAPFWSHVISGLAVASMGAASALASRSRRLARKSTAPDQKAERDRVRTPAHDPRGAGPPPV